MVMPMRTYRARWIMELSTFRPPGPDLLGPASVPLAAVVPGPAVVPAADVVTSFTACTEEKQQNRTRTRTHNRNELILTVEDNSSLKTEPSQETPPLLIKSNWTLRHP